VPKAAPVEPKAAAPEIDLPEIDLPAIPMDLPVIAGGNLPARAQKPPPAPKRPPPPAPKGADAPPPSADLPELAGAGLPAIPRAGLPAPKRPAAPAAPREIADLPDLAIGLPLVSASLPAVSAQLPAPSAALPTLSAQLPSPAAALPIISAPLPQNAAALPNLSAPLPQNAAGLPALGFGAGLPLVNDQHGFGEIELPGSDIPEIPKLDAGGDFGDFGELDLPTENAGPTSDASRRQAIGDLDFEGSAAHKVPAPPASGGALGFGERDLDAGDDAGEIATEAPIGGDAPIPSQPPGRQSFPGGAPAGGLEANIPMAPLASTSSVRDASPSDTSRLPRGKAIAVGLVALLVVGGAALQLTPFGAFGYLKITDLVKAGSYAATTRSAADAARAAMASDTYDDAKAAVDAVARAHAGAPRATALTAYAAFADFEVAARFGSDPARPARGAQWLAELDPSGTVQYRDAALAAKGAATDDLATARAKLDAASRQDPGDPIQTELALLRGEVELHGKNAKGAADAFQKAIAAGAVARGHFGLARADVMAGDLAGAKKEVDATLAASPAHPGALTLRAELTMDVDGAAATKDLAAVLDGASRAKAAPSDLAEAYADRGWMELEHGGTTDARAAFDQAIKLSTRNVRALAGQGELLFREGRYTEAFARFDTARQVDPDDIGSIVGAAKTEILLERLADAKAQLVAAQGRFPKEMRVPLWLGKVDAKLSNLPAAEADFRAAIALTDPARQDSISPYVALSGLLTQEGRGADAQSVLDDAQKKLPSSATLDRALGEVAEQQGNLDVAAAHFKAAIAKEPKDLAAHFRLASTLRKEKKYDAATAELEIVEASDPEYPGLALERGQLYQESGDIQKAIDQFKAALAKAPDDADLALRVGSAYVVIDRPDDAIPQLKRALEKRPTSAEAHHFLGRAFFEKGKGSEADAMRELKRAVDLDPNRAEFHMYVGWLAMTEANPDLALANAEVDQALSLDQGLSDAWWLKGLLECRSGGLDTGLHDVKHSIELRPSRGEAHAALAECSELRNDSGGAIGEWSRAVASDPTNAFWQYRLGKALYDKKSGGEAMKHFSVASAAAQTLDPRPAWVAPLEFAYAESLRKAGNKAEAYTHYMRYMAVAPLSSPDYKDAQLAVAELKARGFH
jgi:tetratricopeptide (TPR) repeat protein